MGDEGQIGGTIQFSKIDLERIVNAVVQANKDRLSEELRQVIADKDGEVRKKVEEMLSRVDAQRDRVDTKIGNVDNALEKLQERVSKRVNTYVVPAVVLTFVAIMLAIFTAIGGFGVISDVKNLKDSVATASGTFSTTQAALASLTKSVDSATATANNDRFLQLQAKIDDLNKKLDDVRSQPPPHSQSSNSTTKTGFTTKPK